MSQPGDPLEAALAEHRAALDAYLARASEVPAAEWDRPATPGKWSAAEITEHLRLTLERLQGELRGEPAMKYVLPWWKRLLLRRGVLPRMFRTGRFPRGAPAPRETRPGSSGPPRPESMRRLRAAAAEFEAGCLGLPSATRCRLTHPYFGRLPLPRFHRLLALHTLHHREQLPRVRGRGEEESLSTRDAMRSAGEARQLPRDPKDQRPGEELRPGIVIRR